MTIGQARQSTCVSILGRGVLIEGQPGSGKSSLAMALIDRGADMVGDDSVLLEVVGSHLIAHPHPRTKGIMEVRNLGLLPYKYVEAAPISLVVLLDCDADRFIDSPEQTDLLGIQLPVVRLWPNSSVLPIKVELALANYGAL